MKSLRITTLTIAVCLVVGVQMDSQQSVWAQGSTPSGQQPGVGQRAIDFELPLVKEEGYLSLSDTYKQGPTVVIFLRGFPGYQCPICTSQVGSLINRAKALSQAAHRVVLVYPGAAKNLDRQAEQFLSARQLPPPLVLVRDDAMQVVEQWGLRWNASRETAYPATFVLDRYGRVAWKKVATSHAERSSVEEILKELRKL